MEILEAIQARRSVRDFSDTPVSKETIMKIMEVATRSPSGGNGQPWEIFVAAGETLKRIRQVYQERAQQAAPGTPPPPPVPLPAFIQERMTAVRVERMKLLGLDPANPASGKVLMEMGTRLYGAPAIAVICMDKSVPSNLDIGLLVQSICLAALGLGVDSLIATSIVAHPDVLRKELEVSESLNIVTAVGLGYANPQNAVNTYRSPRRPIQEVVRYRD
jgi:nitroreductase